jgi:hypothetical protein
VLARYESLQGGQVRNLDPILNRITGVPFHNTSRLSFDRPKDDPSHIAANVTGYIKGFSDNAREVIRLMANLLFMEDHDVLTRPGIVKTLYDPACGTGGMLSVAEEYLRELNPDASLKVFGQELNDESFAICE